MPGSISVRGAWSLTGRRRYRVSWLNKLILQVQEGSRLGHTCGPQVVWSEYYVFRWRDATQFDVEVTQWQENLKPGCSDESSKPSKLSGPAKSGQ